ncbi:MAG: pilus assembly PilX N-terminal domain-containing protein [Candidatus Omnitrophota bacterium]
MNQKKGVALVLALIVMSVLIILGAAYLIIIIAESGIARNQENSEKAFFVAEAGIERGIRYMIENPDTSSLPWTTTENISDGSYTLIVDEAVDIGNDYVRITSSGMVHNARRITELILYQCAWKYLLVSNNNIVFGDSATGTVDGDIHANRSVLGLDLGTGVDYVEGSRSPNTNQDVIFEVRNNTGSMVYLTDMTVTLSTPPAYYTEVRISVIGGTNYGVVWDRSDNGGVRAASGQKIPFRTTVQIPAGSNANIEINGFRQNPTGGGGANQDMDDTTFDIIFWAGALQYPTVVGLAAGTGDSLVVTGSITQGDKGDPLVNMPVVDMLAYRNNATQVVIGDYVFNGSDGFVEGFAGGWAQYTRERYYITGKATINTFYQNLDFDRCLITAEGGIEIITRPAFSGIDYVELSRQANTNEDVIFRVENNTGSNVTVTDITVSWTAPPTAFYEEITVRVIGGINYGTVWSFPPRAGNDEKVLLSPDPVIPSGRIAEIEILNFSKKRDRSQPSDMDNEEFWVTFWAGATGYEASVLRAGEILAPAGQLRFRCWSPFPSLVTKTGNIIEQDSINETDRDFDGIIYSEQGKVQFENLLLDGAILANEIEITGSLDLEYRPQFVSDPAPDFIGGLSFLNWQENY